MFFGRMEEYKIEKPEKKDDGCGFVYTEYVPYGRERIYIVEEDRTTYNSNDLNLTGISVVGYTQATNIKEGYRIAGKYVVSKVLSHKTSTVLYMDVIEDGI